MRVFPLALGTVALVACGGGQTRGAAFDPAWRNDDGAAVSAFQAAFQGTPVPRGADVAVGVSGERELCGIPLSGGPAWTFAHALDDRPALAGTVVVGLGAGELFALDARTGALLWKRAAGGRLRGAGDDGVTTVISTAPTTATGSLVLAITHDGHVVRQIEDAATIGVPAVIDGTTFLPWQGQYVTAYDLAAGEERARALFRSATSRAFVVGGALFFGETGATRFDARIGRAPRNEASFVRLPLRELPGAPRWMRPGSDTPPLATAPFDSARLYARPTAAGAPGIVGGRYVATYLRLAVGLDATSGAVAWAHAHDAGFLGGAAYEGGFALCDAKGVVTFLDARAGGVTGQVALGKTLTSCAVQADAFTQPAPGPSPSLVAQIAAIGQLPDPDLAPMQRFLVRELARLADPAAAPALRDLCAAAPPAPREAACAALAEPRR
jgi:outer membrane protein assembly factor BamB